MDTAIQKDEKNTVGEEPIIYSDSENAPDVTGETDTGTESDVGVPNGDPVAKDGGEVDESETDDEESVLRELEDISGRRYGSISEFPEYRRYLELRKSGLLSAEEAFYAVNRGNNARNAREKVAFSDAKRHLTPSAGKRSSGEVFTREDREELAKWGISATGDQLERLWREAGR